MTTEAPFATLQLQPRDLALLCGLFESRIMTAGHISILYFDGKREYAKKRLQRLKAAGLVGERRRRMNERSMLFLTRKGFTLLKSGGHLDGYPPLGGNSFEARASVSELTIRHEIEIMDVKAAFHSAMRRRDGFSITDFCTWPILHQFEVSRRDSGRDALVKPDGFISIHEAEDGTKGYAHDFFFELDRSSESQETLVDRAACYVEYYKSGGYAVRNGGARGEFREYPFRVLVVLKTAERRNNTAERLLHSSPPILTQVWLTTFAEATSDPFGAIWVQPLEYGRAVEGTAFDTAKRSPLHTYSRRTARESLVEGSVKKLRLLD